MREEAGRPRSAAADEAALLGAEKVSYSAGGTVILDGVDLDVKRGEMVGVIGPNGAGKTTLLRVVAGLLPPASGRVLLSGKDVHSIGHRERARMVSFMSQEASLELSYPVIEVLLMGRYPYMGRFERESAADFERARGMLSYVGLAGLEERPFGELSGGEQQLVLFAKTLVQETGLVVLDEPSSHLDIRHQDRIFSMASELAREGRGVIVSVHNLDVAAHYCARLLLLDRGRSAGMGKPQEVLVPEVLDGVYGVKTMVSRNTATGSLTVSVVPFRASAKGARVHLIGGAGSAVNLTRELYRLGFQLSGGIAHSLDSDETLWKNLGVPCSSVGAFARIAEDDIERAAPLVEAAELTVLCSFPIGQGNLGNLLLARRARSLVVLQPGPGEAQRTFFAEEGRSVFSDLLARAEVTDRDSLLAKLMRESRQEGGR